MQNYGINNKEKFKGYRKKRKLNHSEEIKEYYKKYQIDSRLNNPLLKIKHNIRNRLWSAFKNKNWKKQGSEKLLGTTYENVKSYIESLFTENISWENYGLWHIDHIVPLSSATSKEEMEFLCNYKNLQPLWASDNISKGNRY